MICRSSKVRLRHYTMPGRFRKYGNNQKHWSRLGLVLPLEEFSHYVILRMYTNIRLLFMPFLNISAHSNTQHRFPAMSMSILNCTVARSTNTNCWNSSAHCCLGVNPTFHPTVCVLNVNGPERS